MTAREAVERLYLDDRSRILATLIGLVRDFDLAEESMQEAFTAALSQWEERGLPDNPRAWIVSAARHKAIDRLRRESRSEELTQIEQHPMPLSHELPPEDIPDDRLRLIFTCCHPALPAEGQVALTLRTLCGIPTPEIARMFLVPAATMAQRLVRVQRKIAQTGIPYRVPPLRMLPERLDAVLATVYLIFTSGYAPGNPEAAALANEAIRLARLVVELMPQYPEPRALLALMLLHESRRTARTDATGAIVLLDEQDRTLWNAAFIREGLAILDGALRDGAGSSRYGIEAAIAAVHPKAATPVETDWPQIAALYAVLARIAPSPVVDLNHAVAIAMAEGPEAGLERLGSVERGGRLAHYHLLPAAKAQLLTKLGREDEAADCYHRAIALAPEGPESEFLKKRLGELTPALKPVSEPVRGSKSPDR